MQLRVNSGGCLNNRRVDVELLEVKSSTAQVTGHGAWFHCFMASGPIPKVQEEGHETGRSPRQSLQVPDELWGDGCESDVGVDIKHELAPSIPPHRVGLTSGFRHTIPYVDTSVAQ